MRQLHITNDQGKDTCVNFAGTKIIHPSPKLGKDGEIADRAHLDSMNYYVEGVEGNIPN